MSIIISAYMKHDVSGFFYKARRSCPPYRPDARQRSQSLPVLTENEETITRASSVVKRLAKAQHTLTALLEIEGISQAPAEDVLQTSTLANMVGARYGEQAARNSNKQRQQRDDG